MSYMLELINVHKTFNIGTINEKIALDGVNLQLNPGDFVTKMCIRDRDNVATIYYAMRTDILDKYNLTEQAQNIKSVDDIEAILQIVKDNEASLVPLYCQKDQGVLTCGCFLTGDIADVITYDPLYQEQIVAFPGEDPYTAVDVFHTDAYEAAVTKMHDWYEKGLVFKASMRLRRL